MRLLYVWRTWNAKRERICDSGIVWAGNEAEARRNAEFIAGGPHAGSVVEIQVEIVRDAIESKAS